MVKPFLIGLVAALVLGGAGIFYGIHVLREHSARNEAIYNAKREDIKITIIEGKRREEIAAQLSNAGVTTYDDFMTASAQYEGELFPDTYQFFPNTPATEVLEVLRNNFAEQVAPSIPTKQQMILASIIEREASNDSERAIIAGVYTNRLDIGMKLDADPTVQYAKDSASYKASNFSPTFSFWGSITQADYQGVVSPYNTYRTTELPPAPICNPGLQSIAAAMNPAQHNYLYFVHKNGQILLARTLNEHIQNLNK